MNCPVNLKKSPSHANSATTSTRIPWWMLAAFLVGTLLVYSPAISAGYIWDDDDYVTENPTLVTWGGLIDIWTDPEATPQYYPLVHTSYWLEYRLWKLQPAGYHLVNILLHATNAFLLFLVLRKLGMPWAWFAAAVYAVHPLNVESVAWVTERKNVLAVFFFCLATLSWMKFLPIDTHQEEATDKASPPNQPWLFYALTLLAFLGGLLSKTVTCMWPVAIILLYWGARHRWKIQQLASLLPFYIVGGCMGLLTAYLERKHVGAEGLEWDFSIIEKFMIAGRVFWFYISKTLLPYPLVFFYPRWEITDDNLFALSWTTTAALLVVLLFVFRGKLSRWPLTAVLIYSVTLFPAMGFFAVYPMRYSFVADHFAYIPFLAVMTLAAGIVWQIPHDKVRHGVAIAALAILAVLTFQRCGVYESAETLWLDTLAKNPASCAAHNNLGLVYMDRGMAQNDQEQLSRAAEHFQTLTQCRIEQHKGHYHLGLIATRLGRYDEAVGRFQEALRINPDYVEAKYNLGIALNKSGKPDEAVRVFREVEHSDLVYDARLLAGIISFGQKKYQAAEDDFQVAVDANPTSVEALVNLATTRIKLGQLEAARETLLRAQSVDPHDSGIRQLLSQISKSLGS